MCELKCWCGGGLPPRAPAATSRVSGRIPKNLRRLPLSQYSIWMQSTPRGRPGCGGVLLLAAAGAAMKVALGGMLRRPPRPLTPPLSGGEAEGWVWGVTGSMAIILEAQMYSG